MLSNEYTKVDRASLSNAYPQKPKEVEDKILINQLR